MGAYLGLCPRRDQSGGTDKQLRISKCGDGLLRRLLVSAAHYILGPFGPPCALREHGQRLTGTGSAREKKRAVVAVARKLAVLLLKPLETRHGLRTARYRQPRLGVDTGLNPKTKKAFKKKRMDADLGVMTVRRQSRRKASPVTRWSRSSMQGHRIQP